MLGMLNLRLLAIPALAIGFLSLLPLTHPVKQAVIPLLDDLSEDASALGAVNTVVFQAGRRMGHNTDWSGFAESFRRGLPEAARRSVVQMGGGGAGSAVAYALLDLGVQHLTLFDLDHARACAVVQAMTALFGEGRAKVGTDLVKAMALADGLTNATPVGMAKCPGTPVPLNLLRSELWVAEVVYFPLETELLAGARRAGCPTLDGGGMAVFQAAEAFRLFTSVDPDPERMRERFLEDVRNAAKEPVGIHD